MILGAYATINLDAVKHNVEKIREYAPKAKIMAVIKANAYGHGLLRIAEVLRGVDALAVARVDEGIRLRQAGFANRITVLEGFVYEDELDDLVDYDLDIVVHSLGQIAILEKYNKGGKKVFVWLKHDTGMNRLGFKMDEFEIAYQRLLNCACVDQPVSLMTHLSSADIRESHITLQQISLFNERVKKYPGDKSIANSAAIIVWPDSISDWVRPGIMMYGVSPFIDKSGIELGFQPVMSLYSRLISVKNVAQGEVVGYAGTWACKKDSIIGVVAIGYGDGYPRYAQTGTPVLVNGKRVSLVGRVSMDMITVDLSELEDAKPGDLATLWGDGLAVEEVARYADTIPYTLLCGITQRVKIKKI